jgi:ABC-type methionine transport system ATPase subunit
LLYIENITFGAPYDQERLKKVIKWCELESDLKNFPGGVESEVGERGVTLSGGQKQRVSIARAIYPIKELYLFDDCLSALDRHVSKNIFAQCLSEKGALQGKTRVLATHAVHFARYADQIIVMDKLKLVETGSFDDLVKKPNGIFAKMYKTREKSHIQNDISSANQACLPEVVHSNMLTDLGGSKGKVIEIENKAKGTLSFKVYMSYLSSCGILFVLVAIFLLVISQVRKYCCMECIVEG